MRVFIAALAAAAVLVPFSAQAAVHPHHHTSTHALMRRTSMEHAHHASAEHFFSSIDSERATEIQSALIKQGYLTGEPTGSWDQASVAAMQKLQGDNGWQTKLVPDSRALIKLGLGPNSDAAPAAASVEAPDAGLATDPISQ